MSDNKIKGTVLCRRRDEYGEIIVAEEDRRRTLYFGDGIIQSAIRTDRPDLLLEDYNEALMNCLIFKSEPRSILLVGLGGCSLVHFLMKAAPHCSIDIAEIRQQVIDLSRDFFFLPPDNPNLKILHASGGEFIASRRPGSRRYDIIIVDAFDESGPAASLLKEDFLSACRARLNQSGVFIVNLWNSPGHDFPARYGSIQAAFSGNALKLLLSESYRNAVAFGFENPATCRNLPDYRPVAADLQSKYRINFPRYLKNLQWQNFDDQKQ